MWAVCACPPCRSPLPGLSDQLISETGSFHLGLVAGGGLLLIFPPSMNDYVCS